MLDHKPRCIGLQICCENFNKTEQIPEKLTMITHNHTCGTRNDEGFLYTLRNNLDVAQFGNLKSDV